MFDSIFSKRGKRRVAKSLLHTYCFHQIGGFEQRRENVRYNVKNLITFSKLSSVLN
jgi:hypothetical protein